MTFTVELGAAIVTIILLIIWLVNLGNRVTFLEAHRREDRQEVKELRNDYLSLRDVIAELAQNVAVLASKIHSEKE